MGRPGTKHERLAEHRRAARNKLPPAFDPRRPEQSFAETVPLEHRRRFGQFFTPVHIARAMCQWVAEIGPRSILDPAAGVGVFVRELHGQQRDVRITAIELDAVAMQALRACLPKSSTIDLVGADFLTWHSSAEFDGILANPPYLRHHDLHYPFDVFQAIGSRCGVRLSRLTNAYALFLLEICRRLRGGGRAAVIVPTEWLNANFGRPIKEFLLRHDLLRHLIYFSHETEVFADALTTSCVLLLEKSVRQSEAQHTVHTVFARAPAEDFQLANFLATGSTLDPDRIEHTFTFEQLRSADKWAALIESGEQTRVPGFVRLSELATTSRGIATGANAFFHIRPSQWAGAGMRHEVRAACIGRAEDAGGLIFSAADFEQLVARDRRTWLLRFPECVTAAERQYLERGEAAGLPKRFLLAARRPWYRMELREPAPLWAAVFGRRGLRFIWNRAEILHLTTFHGIYPFDARPQAVAALAAMLNSRVVQQRAVSQQRVYGGGLRKYEPRDLLQLEVPDLRRVPDALRDQLASQLAPLDEAYRSAPAGSGALERALAVLDELVLEAARCAGA